MIASELRSKGVTQDQIDIALEEIDEDDEYQTALALGEKKLNSLLRYEPEVQVRRIQSLLARKGFGFSTINRVLSDLGVSEK